MKLPGRAWLQFRVWETDDGKTQLEQTAAFLPKGLGGLFYWYGCTRSMLGSSMGWRGRSRGAPRRAGAKAEELKPGLRFTIDPIFRRAYTKVLTVWYRQADLCCDGPAEA